MQQLKFKDDEYVKAMKMQEDNINELLKEMRKQFIMMREDYSDKLRQIEDAFKLERSEILSKNESEIKALFQEH